MEIDMIGTAITVLGILVAISIGYIAYARKLKVEIGKSLSGDSKGNRWLDRFTITVTNNMRVNVTPTSFMFEFYRGKDVTRTSFDGLTEKDLISKVMEPSKRIEIDIDAKLFTRMLTNQNAGWNMYRVIVKTSHGKEYKSEKHTLEGIIADRINEHRSSPRE